MGIAVSIYAVMKGFLRKNWLLILAIFYLLSPFDLIPDFIPGVGAADDVFVLLATLFIRYREFKKKQEEKVIDGEVVEDGAKRGGI